MDPRAPSVVSRASEPKPACRAHVNLNWKRETRAPFRLFSTRAPRHAELGASFRLAPLSTTRPCDLPAAKTRDASDRHLPSERPRAPVSRGVPSSLWNLSAPGGFAESWPPRSVTGETGVSWRPNRFGGSTFEREPRHSVSPRSGHGLCLPMALDAIEPLAFLSPLPLPSLFARLRVQLGTGGSRLDHAPRHSMTSDTSQ